MAEAGTRTFEDDDRPVVHVALRIKKGVRSMPGFAGIAWSALKTVLLVVFLGLALWIVIDEAADVRTGGRWLIALGLVFGLYDRVMVRPRLGTFHVLVTDRGILFSEHQLYLPWDGIESYQIAGDLLRVRAKPEHAPRGLLAPRELDVPLTAANRPILTELFRERAPRWRPD